MGRKINKVPKKAGKIHVKEGKNYASLQEGCVMKISG